MKFKNWLFFELADSWAKELLNWQQDNIESLQFKNLFDDKLRIQIPFNIDQYAISIIDKLKKIGTIDYRGGYLKIDNRQFKIGKVVLNKKFGFSEEEQYWWNHQPSPIENMEEASKVADYAIIVSRSPIDIARMSDHDGWTSCHSPQNNYFQCALADAKNSGLIAYIVKKESLKKINLQDNEIFRDEARKKGGVEPISRIRIRKFINKQNEDDELAIPEDRLYGKNIPGLQDSVLNWTREIQKDKIEKRPKLKDFYITGGSYQDTSAGALFNNFFEDEEEDDDEDAEHITGGVTSMLDQYEIEVEEIENKFSTYKFKICSWYAEVDESDGHAYVSYSTQVMLPYPEHFFHYEDIEEKQIEALRTWAKDKISYSVYEIDADREDGILFNIESEGSTPDEFKDALEFLKDIEENRDELINSFYNELISLGLATSSHALNTFKTWDETNKKFNNFNWSEINGTDIIINLKDEIAIKMPIDPVSIMLFNQNKEIWQTQFEQLLLQELSKWANYIPNRNQQFLFKQPEFQPKFIKPFSGEFAIKPTTKISQRFNQVNISILLKSIDRDEHTEDAIKFIEFLDKNYEKFSNLVKDIATKATSYLQSNIQHPLRTL